MQEITQNITLLIQSNNKFIIDNKNGWLIFINYFIFNNKIRYLYILWPLRSKTQYMHSIIKKMLE